MPSPMAGTLADQDFVILFINPVTQRFGALDIEIRTLFVFWYLYYSI